MNHIGLLEALLVSASSMINKCKLCVIISYIYKPYTMIHCTNG